MGFGITQSAPSISVWVFNRVKVLILIWVSITLSKVCLCFFIVWKEKKKYYDLFLYLVSRSLWSTFEALSYVQLSRVLMHIKIEHIGFMSTIEMYLILSSSKSASGYGHLGRQHIIVKWIKLIEHNSISNSFGLK